MCVQLILDLLPGIFRCPGIQKFVQHLCTTSEFSLQAVTVLNQDMHTKHLGTATTAADQGCARWEYGFFSADGCGVTGIGRDSSRAEQVELVITLGEPFYMADDIRS